MWFVGHISQGLCDRGFTEGAKDADDAISQRSHRLGRVVRSDGGTVFIKGDITDIVEAVFNAPMATIHVKNPSRVSLVGSKAGNAADSFFGCFLGFEVGKYSVDTKDLPNKGGMQDSGLNRYLSRLAGFQGDHDVCRWFCAEGGKRNQTEVFDVLF